MISEKDSKVIRKIRNGESIMIPLGEEAYAEIHKINDIYFLFQIPQFGGNPIYCNHFKINQIDELIKEYSSWT